VSNPILLNRLLPLVVFSVLLLIPVGAQNAFADVIYESATLGPVDQLSGLLLGTNVNDVQQFIGSRFSISQEVQVTEIGGHLGSGNKGNILFGAIVELTGPNSLPLGSPFTGAEVVAFTTFEPPTLTADVSFPLSVILPPGDYALIFGSDEFGATGVGRIPTNNFDTPQGIASYFKWDGVNWLNLTLDGIRFTVNGFEVGGSCVVSPSVVDVILAPGASSQVIPKSIDCNGGPSNVDIDTDDCSDKGIDVSFDNTGIPNFLWEGDETITNDDNAVPGDVTCLVSFAVENPLGTVVISQRISITTPAPPVVGGEFSPIDTAALVLAGLQTSAIWMLPILAGAAGAGIAAFKLRKRI